MSSFIQLPSTKRIVKGEGPRDARIAIVGEAPGAYEDRRLRPFVGPAGSVLEQCLHTAGLIRGEVYLTNVIKVRPPANNIKPFFDSRSFSAEANEWLGFLRDELDEVKPNIIVACGKTALAALTGETQITALRGYLLDSIELSHCKKILPTIHPAASLYDRKGGDMGGLKAKEFKPYLYRYVISCDLAKAKIESKTQELKRPERLLVYNFGNVHEALEWLDYYAERDIVAFDIEVLNYEVACISFCSDPLVSCSIPLHGRWTEFEEMLIWRGIQRVLGNPKSVKCGQNLMFDIHFLLTRCGIVVRGSIDDTMMAHSVIYPELPKGLAFLGGLYCESQAPWKDMVKFSNIKENS